MNSYDDRTIYPQLEFDENTKLISLLVRKKVEKGAKHPHPEPLIREPVEHSEEIKNEPFLTVLAYSSVIELIEKMENVPFTYK